MNADTISEGVVAIGLLQLPDSGLKVRVSFLRTTHANSQNSCGIDLGDSRIPGPII